MLLFSRWLLIGFSFLTISCSQDQTEHVFDDYTNRMENLLDAKITQIADKNPLPKFPHKSLRTQATVDLRLGLLEVLDLKQCDLLAQISERNSILGKVMLPSQRLQYEISFIERLNTCLEKQQEVNRKEKKNNDDDHFEFIQKLASILSTKKKNLPAVTWNAIYASDEMHQHFSRNAELLPYLIISKPAYSSAIEQTLDHFINLANVANHNESPPDWLKDLEDDFFSLYSSNLGSEILTTLLEMSSRLNSITQLMQTRLEKPYLCHPKLNTRKKIILQNVFLKFYIQKIQPYLARADQISRSWFDSHTALFEALPSPPAMQTYRHHVFDEENPNSLLRQWVKATKNHTLAWQDLLKQCQLNTEDLAKELRRKSDQN